MTNSHEQLYNQSDPEKNQGNEHVTPQIETGELLQANEEKFFELLSPPTELAGELRAQLHTITEQALATTVNPHDQQALMITASIIEWRLLGLTGSPLPPGLVQGYADDGSISIVYDTRAHFGAECARAAMSKLEAVGLEVIRDALINHVQERSQQIEAVFRSTIEDSQAFKFISTLVSSELPNHPEEQPLTPFWRLVRETQIVQTVRTRWGLEPGEQILPYTEAGYDLRRELSRLDEETVPSPMTPDSDPLSRLRSYLRQFVLTEFAKDCPEAVTEFGRDDGDKVIRTDKHPEGYSDLNDYVQAAARKLALQINEVAGHVQIITEEWFYYLIDDIAWPEDAPKEFEQSSRQAINGAWGYLQHKIENSKIFRANDYTSPTNQEAIFHVSLTGPSSAYIDLSQVGKDVSDSHDHYSKSRSSAEINTPPDKHIGDVLRASPNARGHSAHRLIQSEPRQDLPPMHGNEELILRLFGEEFKHAQPYVPGYRLISSTHDTYGFSRDEMGDPYVLADILLTPEQCHVLVAQYSELGLFKLAQTLEQKPHLTVQDLTSIISNQSTYPSLSKAMIPRLPTYVHLSGLEDFEKLIRSGGLYVQCTGAAQFLQLSLEEVFGKGSAATTSGYKLSRRTISTNARHSQTVFTHAGQIYLLDATPSSAEGTVYNDYLFDSTHMQPRRFAFPLAATKTIQIDPRIRIAQQATQAPELREQKIHAIRKSLDAQLMGLLQASNRDAVYEKTNILPIEDPFRATIETTLRATYNEITRDEVERLHHYLTAYQNADEEVRRQMGIRSYETQVIQILQSTTQQLLDQF